jgi:hypothetical protein
MGLVKIIVALALMLSPSIAVADKDFLSGTGDTWDCGTDPTVNVNTSKGTYVFKGACKTINLNGSSTTVTIESVDELNINGASNKVTVDAVDAINVNGASNTVAWKKGKSGDKPTANVVGTGNKVSGPPAKKKK